MRSASISLRAPPAIHSMEDPQAIVVQQSPSRRFPGPPDSFSAGVIDFGQFRLRPALFFDFGQFRPRPISTSANFWMLNFGTTKWALEGGPNLEKVGPRRVGAQRVEAPNLDKVGPRRVGPRRVEPRRVGHRRGWGRRGFTRCTFQGSGLQKHQQNSTKGPQERERRMKIVVGGGKKKSEILGGLAEGCPVEGCPAEGCPAEGSIGNGVQGSGGSGSVQVFGDENRNSTETK